MINKKGLKDIEINKLIDREINLREAQKIYLNMKVSNEILNLFVKSLNGVKEK